MTTAPLALLARAYERLYSERRVALFERLIVQLAVAGFLVHLLLIALARMLPDPPVLLALLDRSYLSALYTPFSFILVYEVLALVLSIPESTSRSIGKQYEIVSLIIIRNTFKDVADAESVEGVSALGGAMVSVLTDMGGGLLMFGIVAVYYFVLRRLDVRQVHLDEAPTALRRFVERKKAISLLLTILLLILTLYNLERWVVDVYQVAYLGTEATVDVKTIFYLDLFTVMIFTDVLILLLSMFQADQYRFVFRNAGFIASTMLLRIALTLEKPYDVGLAVVAMVFGTLVLFIYLLYARHLAEDEKEVSA